MVSKDQNVQIANTIYQGYHLAARVFKRWSKTFNRFEDIIIQRERDLLFVQKTRHVHEQKFHVKYDIKELFEMSCKENKRWDVIEFNLEKRSIGATLINPFSAK